MSRVADFELGIKEAANQWVREKLADPATALVITGKVLAGVDKTYGPGADTLSASAIEEVVREELTNIIEAIETSEVGY